MGKILKKFLLFILILIILGLIATLGFYLIVYKGVPWWLVAAVAVGITGLYIGWIFFRKYFLRSKERRFVQRVIEHDMAAIEKLPVSQRHEMLELQENWKISIKKLQHSHLRKTGNPLYALPWFILIGDSKAGKTSAARNAGISTPMTEISRSSGIGGTRNCDWWFYDKAIILDTAGRYTIPVDEGKDLEEWKEFLVLLSKYRKKEPLNGIIAVISADKLLGHDEIHLREEGQSIRQRIDQMMRTVGAKIPVYVLITKMDLVHGFTRFSSVLPDNALKQAMGYINSEMRIYWHDVLESTIETIAKNLKKLRFLNIHNRPEPEPELIIFPNEFETMIPGMEKFLEAVFEDNPYQETPLLRGIFLSSALRQGEPSSDFLKLTGLKTAPTSEIDSEEGFYLKDFFSSILPKDRNLFQPLREYITWRRLTGSLALTSWSLICLALCGFLGFSFYTNYTNIKNFSAVFSDLPQPEPDIAGNLLMLEKMRIQILEMDRANRSWMLPVRGYPQSIEIADALKQHYISLFRKSVLFPLDYGGEVFIDKEHHYVLNPRKHILSELDAAPVSEVTRGERFAIHVASFRSEDLAVKNVETLTSQGCNAFTQPVTIAGKGDWHRVFAGAYNSRQKARQQADDLKRKKIIDTFSIVAIQPDTIEDPPPEAEGNPESFLEPKLQVQHTDNETSAKMQGKLYIDYIFYVVAQIEILKAYLAGKTLPLQEEFPLISSKLLMVEDPKMIPVIADMFAKTYFAYLSWNNDRAEATQRLNSFKFLLASMIDKGRGDITWLTRSNLYRAPDIGLADFWGSDVIQKAHPEISIPGAYTAKGQQIIQGFITHMENALSYRKKQFKKNAGEIDPGIQAVLSRRPDLSRSKTVTSDMFQIRKKQFWEWYNSEFYRQWYNFIGQFHEAKDHIPSLTHLQILSKYMTTDDSPYFLLLKRAVVEIDQFKHGKDVPPWVEMMFQIYAVKLSAEHILTKEETFKSKLAGDITKFEKAIKVRKGISEQTGLEEKIKRAEAWNSYIESLNTAKTDFSSLKTSFDTYASAFSYPGQPEGDPSAFIQAYNNYYKLKVSMTPRDAFPVVWGLIFGPLDFFLTLTAEQAACYLQNQWQEQVLGYIMAADAGKVNQILFDKNEGLAWKFVDGPAKPFIARTEKGFAVRRDFRKNSLPIKAELISFLNQGYGTIIDTEPEYKVSFETKPIAVNTDALVKPYSAKLSVRCSDQPFVLENVNYPLSSDFVWQPDQCGETVLTIAFPDFQLQKTYPGEMGFAEFLKDFRDGTRTFTVTDFSNQAEHLKAIGMSWIRLTYIIKGGEAVVALLKSPPMQVPMEIVACEPMVQ